LFQGFALGPLLRSPVVVIHSEVISYHQYTGFAALCRVFDEFIAGCRTYRCYHIDILTRLNLAPIDGMSRTRAGLFMVCILAGKGRGCTLLGRALAVDAVATVIPVLPAVFVMCRCRGSTCIWSILPPGNLWTLWRCPSLVVEWWGPHQGNAGRLFRHCK